MEHSYEEMRKVTIDILAERETTRYPPNRFENLIIGVSEVFSRREGRPANSNQSSLARNDELLLQEVFWDLFRQGIITLGGNNTQAYPWFRVSSLGKSLLENEDVYFFHDLSSYELIIRENVPDIDDLTLFYLKEAMQAFLVECRLSSSVMLGVALEHSLDKLYEIIGQNNEYKEHFLNVFEEKTLLRKFNKFKNKLREIQRDLPPDIKEDLDTNLDMIVSVIRNFRNESGHPSGKVLSREQCYVNLHLFIPCCKKIYDLMEFFKV